VFYNFASGAGQRDEAKRLSLRLSFITRWR